MTEPTATQLYNAVKAKRVEKDPDNHVLTIPEIKAVLDARSDALAARAQPTNDDVLSIVDRINDGWEYVRPASSKGRKGRWFRLQDGAGNWTLPDGASEIEEAPMTDAEKAVIYGDRVRVVRATDPPSEDCGVRMVHGPGCTGCQSVGRALTMTPVRVWADQPTEVAGDGQP
jgi:hypothetical protein